LNIDILDLHLRYIINPELCNQRLADLSMDELNMIVSRPLFETIKLSKKDKKPTITAKKGILLTTKRSNETVNRRFIN
jgi:hypothetical protein